MAKKLVVRAPGKPPPEGVALDTLANRRNFGPDDPSAELAKLVARARSKYHGFPFMVALAELRSDLEKSYRNSIYCVSLIEQNDGKLETHYCGNRWCTVCNRIRMGKNINQYVPPIESFGDPYFVTLTVRACGGDDLSARIDAMHDADKRVRDALRKHRTAKLKVKGLRKLEANANPLTGTYNPHFHYVADGRETAERLIEGWLKRWPDDAVSDAQDMRPCDERGIVELLKYATKLVTKGKDGRKYPVPPAMLDTIFRALRRRHTIRPIGFRVAKLVDEEGPLELEQGTYALQRIEEKILWEWDQDFHDWVDKSTGDVLTGYEPNEDERSVSDALRGAIQTNVTAVKGQTVEDCTEAT